MKAIAFAFSLPLLCTSLIGPASSGEFSIQTTFRISDCDGEQKAFIEQANQDAVKLAEAVFDDCGELKTIGEGSKCINWESQAVAEYFGPKAMNQGQRERIFETFNRATKTTPSWASDWWHSRYIDVYCSDTRNECGPTDAAYTVTTNTYWPGIFMCPGFFKNLTDHQTLVDIIKNDETGQKKLNVKNLRSRATTMLHEWLHVKDFSATVCEGGCIDTRQYVGPNDQREEVFTYKAGLSKLLAAKNVRLAARNNDNYAYFAMSMWMQRNFGDYPPYPKMWDNKKSKADNEANEEKEPGYPSAEELKLLKLDEDLGQDFNTTATDDPLYPKEAYPEWYWPVLENLDSPEIPKLNVPPWNRPLLQVTPNDTAGHCATDGSSSPKLDDCYEALGSLYDSMTVTPPLAGGEGWYWAGRYGSCGIQIHYTGNWKDCKATIADVHAHGQLVLNGCADGKSGTVGGYIPFTPENCPGTIDITVNS